MCIESIDHEKISQAFGNKKIENVRRRAPTRHTCTTDVSFTHMGSAYPSMLVFLISTRHIQSQSKSANQVSSLLHSPCFRANYHRARLNMQRPADLWLGFYCR